MNDLPLDILVLLNKYYLTSVSRLMLKHTNHCWQQIVGENFNVSTRNIAEKGHLNVLQWLKDYGHKPNKWTFAYAAKGGHLDILKWLREIECEGTYWATNYAAHNGHLDVLMWLKDNGYQLHENAINYAASGGHLNIIRWLKKTKCPITEKLTEWAAKSNDMDIIIWGYINDIKISMTCIPSAARNGNTEMLDFLICRRCEINIEPTTRLAIVHGRMNVLEYLHRNNLIDESCLNICMYKENLKILKWVKNTGYQIIISDYLKEYIFQECKNKRMIAWLKENNYI